MIFVDNCTGNDAYIGDLYCDDENNNIFCQFDGGDCCNSQMTQLNFCEECACFKGKYCIHCKYLNARFECNDIVIFIYSHYPLDPNAKLSDTKCFTLSIR